jgi:hypothetical protein
MLLARFALLARKDVDALPGRCIDLTERKSAMTVRLASGETITVRPDGLVIWRRKRSEARKKFANYDAACAAIQGAAFGPDVRFVSQ